MSNNSQTNAQSLGDFPLNYPTLIHALDAMPSNITHIIFDISNVLILKNIKQKLQQAYSNADFKNCMHLTAYFKDLTDLAGLNNRTFGILSNTSHYQIYDKCVNFKKYGFAPVVFTIQTKIPKPIPKAYQHYMQILEKTYNKKFNPHNIAYIDDNQANLAIAKYKLGWYTIQMLPPGKKAPSLALQPYINAFIKQFA